MSSRGFEFSYNMDGSNHTPKTMDITMGETTAYKVGDVVLIQSDGYADKLTGSIDEVTGVMAEAVTPASADTTAAKVWIATSQQVWRCSSDATTATTAIVGYIKTLDLADQNTIDASDITNGSLTLVDKSQTDDDGNLLFYVTFSDTTFGNA